MSHTKGPWTRDKHGHVIGPDGRDVMFRSLSTLSSGSDERMAMAEANTDLASCSPELLEALEDFVSAYEIDEGPNSRTEAARALIDKARGQ